MNTKKTRIIRAHSDLPISKFVDKLHKVTADEFDVVGKSRKYQYYGKIDNQAFDLRNVKYGPFSSGPSIQGEFEQKSSDDDTTLTFNIDIEEDNKYANTILTLTIMVIAILVTLLSIGNQAHRLITPAIFGVILLFVSFYVLMIKLVLKSTRKSELNKFLEITESTLI